MKIGNNKARTEEMHVCIYWKNVIFKKVCIVCLGVKYLNILYITLKVLSAMRKNYFGLAWVWTDLMLFNIVAWLGLRFKITYHDYDIDVT